MKVIGIRPGEKLHELMIGEDDGRHTVEFAEHYVITPQAVYNDSMASLERMLDVGGEAIFDGFIYASDTNDRWLDAEGLTALLNEVLPSEVACT